MSTTGRLNRWVLSVEARCGWPVVSALMGLLGLGLAALCVRPGTEPVSLGSFYAALSLAPLAFDADNPVGFRILTPLVSWCIGLRGDAIQITNLGLAAMVLAWIYRTTRLRAPEPGDAVFAVAVFALSLVTLSTVFSPSYCDPATYLAVLGMLAARQRRLVYYGVFLLGLFNRESLVFLVPWFVYLDQRGSAQRGRLALEQLLGFGLAFAVLLAFRSWVSSQIVVGFDLEYYAAPLRSDLLHYYRMTWGRQWIGGFSVFGLLWAIPVAAFASKWRRGDHGGLVSMALVWGCAWAQLFVAYDTSRLLTLGFPVMLLALQELFAHPAFGFRRWLPWLLLVHFFLPHVRTAQDRVWTMEAPWRALVAWVSSF